jgi:hypothetical protein
MIYKLLRDHSSRALEHSSAIHPARPAKLLGFDRLSQPMLEVAGSTNALATSQAIY